jgi:hypothetical protein
MAHVAVWQHIKQRKQMLMNKNNKKENKKQIDHDCTVGKSIMKIEAGTLKMEQPREGPSFEIVRVHANGTAVSQHKMALSKKDQMCNKSSLAQSEANKAN